MKDRCLWAKNNLLPFRGVVAGIEFASITQFGCEQHYLVSQAAEALGIPTKLLYTWRKQEIEQARPNALTLDNYADALNRMNSSPNISNGENSAQTARGRTYVMGTEIRF
ncbi:hypothetical protein [Xenorhabdus innexi]|uniref:Transposase n=1 Tax=Xenorhabdus innexi TaxID=290109 RepID=A0A1N6MYS6_9GAMM|nr:hypothetical protein [Xenorhabdus innexi]PHM31226.1 transposase [Xenorhabdus innexi]SIP74018.1 hypothetical protein XIS1_490015 [Xenorhabdus innexi]